MGGLYFLGVVQYAFMHSLIYNVLMFELIQGVCVFPIPLCYAFLLLVHGCVVVCVSVVHVAMYPNLWSCK